MEIGNSNVLLGKLYASIGSGNDVSTNQTFNCTSNLVRIAAYEDSQIKSSKYETDNIGIFIPNGTVEYFRVNVGEIITIVSGSVNISAAY